MQHAEWQPIDTAPRDGREVLGWGPNGIEIVLWEGRQEDGPDQPGHDGGWFGTYAFPGRTREAGFGGADHWISGPLGQPTHWMPLPTPPND